MCVNDYLRLFFAHSNAISSFWLQIAAVGSLGSKYR